MARLLLFSKELTKLNMPPFLNKNSFYNSWEQINIADTIVSDLFGIKKFNYHEDKYQLQASLE